MKMLSITKAKPNPHGKDIFGNLMPSQQLVQEWLDFRNTGDEPFPMHNVELYHLAYPANGSTARLEKVARFSALGHLSVGVTVRLHSGHPVVNSLLDFEDRFGADIHLYTDRDVYIWNNDKMDKPSFFNWVNGKLIEIDSAFYVAYPPEGILIRRGDMLVSA